MTTTNLNETQTQAQTQTHAQVQNQNVNAGKSGSRWKAVTIGGVAGIAMGVSGTLAGTAGIAAAEAIVAPDIDSPETPDAPKVNGGGNAGTVEPAAPVATSVSDDMSFGEAFAAARAEVGPGGVFEWRGNVYNTYHAEEWNSMSAAERDEFFDSVANPSEDAPVDDTFDVAPVATSVNDDMSFDEAFAAARAEVGAGGVFGWHGNTYNTFYAEEWNGMSDAERDAFNDSIAIDEPVVIDEPEPVVFEEPEPFIIDEPEPDVHVIGVYEGEINGQDVYVGEMQVDGYNAMLVDIDQDLVFDIAAVDMNDNYIIEEEEVCDISDARIGIEDFVARGTMEEMDDLTASNDLPDYMNDADVSIC